MCALVSNLAARYRVQGLLVIIGRSQYLMECAEEKMTAVERVLKELSRLPEPLVQEVLEFISYLELKHGFSDLSSSKKRPVLVITKLDRHGDFVSLAITSVFQPGGGHFHSCFRLG